MFRIQIEIPRRLFEFGAARIAETIAEQ